MPHDPSELELIRVGQIVGPVGIQGMVRVNPTTDFLERFEQGKSIYVQGQKRRIKGVSWHKGQARLKLHGIDSVEAAESLRWEAVSVPASARPALGPDEYLSEDLVGLTVLNLEGTVIGTVQEVLAAPAHDLIVVKGAMIPAVKEFVKSIDLSSKTMTVALIPGMMEDAQ